METPNSVEQAFEAAPVVNPPSDAIPTGTVTPPTDNGQQTDAEPIDYKEKFSASSREAQRLAAENAAKDAEIERLRVLAEQAQISGESGELYPGFSELDEEAKTNLLNYTRAIEERVTKGIYNDPAIAHSRRLFNEQRFDTALNSVAEKFPQLKEKASDFKSKYFNPSNTPDNIEEILTDLSKVYLFDQAQEIGAAEERERANRIDMERASGGDRQNAKHTSRSLDEWKALQESNPSEFARLSKEYETDVASGKLGE